MSVIAGGNISGSAAIVAGNGYLATSLEAPNEVRHQRLSGKPMDLRMISSNTPTD